MRHSKGMRLFRGILLISCALLAASGLRAAIEFPTTVLNLEAELGEQAVTALFPYENTGDSVASIVKTRSSCGCTAAVLDQKTLQPGESGTIKAVFTLGNRKGLQKKTIWVETDDGRTHTLTLQVDIPVALSIEPRMLAWSRANPQGTQTFTVTLKDPENWQLLPIAHSPNGFQFSEPTTSEDRRTYRFTVEVSEGAGNLERVPIRIRSKDGAALEETLFLLLR